MQYAGKLFGAFQRMHPPEEFAGHGIGLATVQRVVRQHGGNVWAEATPEQGAAFSFTLDATPARPLEEEPPRPLPAMESGGRRPVQPFAREPLPYECRRSRHHPATAKTILLVEDNPDDEALTLRALSRNGIKHQVQVAHDGVEALDYLLGRGEYAGRDLRQMPAVTLLDLKLPRLDGLAC